MALLEVKDVSKSFPILKGVFRRKVGEVKALQDVCLFLEKKQVHAIVGESGSGKTTLGRLAIRLLKPTSGQILFKGNDLSIFSQAELFGFRREVQMIFQDPSSSLNPRQTILEAIGNGIVFHGLAKTEEEKGSGLLRCSKR